MEDESTKKKRIEEIIDAILGTRNIASTLGETDYVSIRDYTPRLVKLVLTANNIQLGFGDTIRSEFLNNSKKLGYINSLVLIGYLQNRIIYASQKKDYTAEIVRIPGIVASITNGLADNRCMYDFINQKLNTDYDKPVQEIEREARAFEKSYNAASLEFSDDEQKQLAKFIDKQYDGNFQEFKKMLVELHLTPAIKQVLDILKDIEQLENKVAK